jgi:hypothetical protein
MKMGYNIMLVLTLVLSLVACDDSNKKTDSEENEGWKTVGQVEKAIKNIHFIFPDSGFAFDNKEKLIDESFDAMKTDSDLIGLNDFKDTIFIRFLRSREEMFPLSGTKASGNAYPHISTLYVVANENSNPPIKHELMHLISMLEWDYPPASSTWLNEGLGTFAENNCSGFSVAEIYRYLLETNQLIPINLLTSDFYKQPEMHAYHQSGYLVEYLLKNYGVEQFEQLWKIGFGGFENVYGIPFESMKAELEKDLMIRFPKSPSIDPDTFSKPCQ